MPDQRMPQPPSAPATQDFASSACSRTENATQSLPLVLDTTMFWSATGGGVRRYLTTKRQWLQQQGVWRHALVAPGVGCGEGIDTGGLPLGHGYRLPLRRRAMGQAMEALRPELIEAGDPYCLAWSALDASQRLGVPAVAFCHSDLTAMAQRLTGSQGPVGRWARRAAASYLRRVYAEFDLVLAPGRSVVQMLRGLGLDRVRQQPLGVDAVVFRPQPADADLRQRLGLRPDARLLLYAGRLAPEKNLPLLVQAVARLGAPYVLLVVGAGPVALPAGPQLRLLPFEASAHALAKLCASVDAFVHAGDQETFGLAALEAMACATPVVVRDSAGLGELVDAGAAIGVKSDRPEAWAEAIAALFAPAGGLEVWGRRALVHAQRYRWELVLPMLLGHYNTLLARRDKFAAADVPATQPGVAWRGSL